MSAASVQLVRLISLKTAPKRASSGASSASESSASAVGARPSLLGGRRRASSAAQVRLRVCVDWLSPSHGSFCLVLDVLAAVLFCGDVHSTQSATSRGPPMLSECSDF